MNKKFYTLLLAPLVFVACNTNQPTVEVKEVKKSPVVTKVEQKEIVKEKYIEKSKDTVTTIDGVKFVEKPIVQEQGLFHIQSFIGTLQPTLESAMKDDGPLVGMGVCASLAMQMTDDYNAVTTDIRIRRTAIKYRNLKNKPDAIDSKVMNELVKKGDFEPVTVDVGSTYRVYKPLPTNAECLVCHGDSSSIPKKVSESIKRKYPKDLAIDFVKGEFRGVVIVEISK